MAGVVAAKLKLKKQQQEEEDAKVRLTWRRGPHLLTFPPRTDLIPIGPRRRRRLITRGRRGQLSRSSSVWRSLLFTSEMSQSSFLHKLSLISQNMFWSSLLLSDKVLKNNNRIQIFLFLSAFLFFCLDSLLFLQTYRTARKLWKRKLFTNFFMKTI